MSNFTTKNLSDTIRTLGGAVATARVAGLKTTQTLLNWQQSPPAVITQMLAIADAAGVSLDWLAGRDGAAKDYPPRVGAVVEAMNQAQQSVETQYLASQKNMPSELIEIPVWHGDKLGLEYMTFRAAYLNHRLRIPSNELMLVPVFTTDAAPVLVDGGVCICHQRADTGEGIWAFDCVLPKYQAFFRRAVRRTDSKFTLHRLAPNAQDTEVITAAALRKAAIGRVVWGGERFFK